MAVPVVNNTECQRMYNFFPGSIDRTHICAGYPEGIKDACEVCTRIAFNMYDGFLYVLSKDYKSRIPS